MRSTWSCKLWWTWSAFRFVESTFFLPLLSFALSNFMSPSLHSHSTLNYTPPFFNCTTLTAPNILLLSLHCSPCSSQVLLETSMLDYTTPLFKPLQWLSTALWVNVWSLNLGHRPWKIWLLMSFWPLVYIMSPSMAIFCTMTPSLPPTGGVFALDLHGATLEAGSHSLHFSSNVSFSGIPLLDYLKRSFPVSCSHHSVKFPFCT